MDFEKETQSLPSSPNRGISVRVLWTITDYKVGEAAAWGEDQARNMLFKPLEIDDSKIGFDGETCANVSFEKKMMNAREYFWKLYRITPHYLGVEDEELQVIKTNCRLPGFSEYMRLKDNRLLVYVKGVFFYFSPNVNY